MESQDISFDQELRQMFQNYHHNTRQNAIGSMIGGGVSSKHVKHLSQYDKDDRETQYTTASRQNFDSGERKQSFTSAKMTALNRYQSQINVTKSSAHQGAGQNPLISRKDSTHSHNTIQEYNSRRFTQLSSHINKPSAQHSTIQLPHFQSQLIHKKSSQSQSSGGRGDQLQNQRKQKPLVSLDFSNQHLHQIPSHQEIVEQWTQNSAAQKNSPIELILNNNSIQSIVRSYSQFPPTMRVLSLKNNQINYISGLGVELAPRLKVLDLTGNRIESLEGLKQAGRLVQLNLNSNFIKDTDLGYISGLQRLKIVDISNNKLKDSFVISRILSYWVELRSLSLSSNQLQEIFKIDTPLPKLKELFLQDNKIQNFIINQPCQNLKILNISKNLLKTFKGIDKFANKSLDYFDVSFNELTYLSAIKDNYNSLFDLRRLKTLNANSNIIKQFLSSDNLQELQLNSLQEIYLRENKLKQYKFLNNIETSRLRVVDLGCNQICRIEILKESLKTIKDIYLDKNQIEFLTNLENYQHSNQIVLANNPIIKSEDNQKLLRELKDILKFDPLDFQMSNKTPSAVKNVLVPKKLNQNTQELTLSSSLFQKQNFIRNVDLEDSKDQNEIFNEVIKFSHRQSLANSLLNSKGDISAIPFNQDTQDLYSSTKGNFITHNQQLSTLDKPLQKSTTPINKGMNQSPFKLLLAKNYASSSKPQHFEVKGLETTDKILSGEMLMDHEDIAETRCRPLLINKEIVLQEIQIEKIINEVANLAKLVKGQGKSLNYKQSQLYDEVSKEIINKMKFAFNSAKDYIQETLLQPQQDQIIVEDNTIELTQYNSNTPIATDLADTFNLLRTQLSELIIALHQTFKKQSLTNSNSTNHLSQFFKDLCQYGFNLKLSNFQLGKYLFSRKEEIQQLEREILLNPECILRSQILIDLLKNELNLNQIDIGTLRNQIMLKVQELNSQLQQQYTIDSLENEPPTLSKAQTKENQRYNPQPQVDSILNINEISEIKPQQIGQEQNIRQEVSPISYLKRLKKNRQQSLGDKSQNKENNQQLDKYQNKQIDQPRSYSQQQYNSRQQQNQALVEVDRMQSQNNYETQATSATYYSRQGENYTNQTPVIHRSNQSKSLKVLQQINTYSKHPLVQITQQQSNVTFIHELQPKESTEFKLLKYLLRTQQYKPKKIFKSYNYNLIQTLDNGGPNSPQLWFAYIKKDLARQVFENQDSKILEGLTMSNKLENYSLQQLQQSFLIIILARISRIYSEDKYQQGKTPSNEQLRQMGFQARRINNESLVCIDASQSFTVYLLDIVPKKK